jgi:hypothetical protein
MPKHVGVEMKHINKNPLLPSEFVGIFTNETVTGYSPVAARSTAARLLRSWV